MTKSNSTVFSAVVELGVSSICGKHFGKFRICQNNTFGNASI